MGFEHFHISKAGAPFRHAKAPATSSKARRAVDSTTPDPSCKTGAFYSAPALGASIDSMSPLNVVWKPELACLQPVPSLVDVYVFGPGDATPLLHTWTGVPYTAGNHSLTLLPRWWGATPSKSLQLMVVPADTPVFLSTLPAGPVFTATYTPNTTGPVAPAADTSLPTDSTTTVVTATALGGVSTHGMSAGKKAAAVLLPLLFVLLLGLAYLKISRARGAAKRSAWSEKLDKRMSTISADWKSITPGGAKEAVRQSMAIGGRPSTSSAFSFGAIRTGAVEGEPVVMGEKSAAPVTRGGSIEISEKDLPRTTLGAGVGVGVGARRPRAHAAAPDRGSRAVSFADSVHPRPSTGSGPRPSIGSRPYSRGSRAFHTASYAGADEDEAGAAPPVPALPSPSRAGAFGAIERISSTGTGAANTTSVYQNGAAWSSGERVEGVDGGYGARSVSPTGRVHTVNYPATMNLNTNTEEFAYGTPSNADASYFSPATPTPYNTSFSPAYATDSPASAYPASGFGGQGAYGGTYGDETHESAYAPNTFGSFTASPNLSETSSGGVSAMASPRQIGGPLTLTPEDIRRRMTVQHGNGQESWRQSVDEVFGALSMMRTGGPTSPDAEAADNEDDNAGEYLFAPQQAETVFQYPGTPAPGSAFSSPAIPASPFAMPMQPPTMSPDDMLRAYAAKHASTASSTPSPLARAEVVASLKDTGMRVLYKPEDEGSAAAGARAASPALIRAGPGARVSR